MTRTSTQANQILSWLKRGKSITPIEALERFGSLRLGARIFDLRREGHVIEMKLVTRGDKHFARYRLTKRAA